MKGVLQDGATKSVVAVRKRVDGVSDIEGATPRRLYMNKKDYECLNLVSHYGKGIADTATRLRSDRRNKDIKGTITPVFKSTTVLKTDILKCEASKSPSNRLNATFNSPARILNTGTRVRDSLTHEKVAFGRSFVPASTEMESSTNLLGTIKEKPAIEGAKPKTLTKTRVTDKVLNLDVHDIDGATVRKIFKTSPHGRESQFNRSGGMAGVLAATLEKEVNKNFKSSNDMKSRNSQRNMLPRFDTSVYKSRDTTPRALNKTYMSSGVACSLIYIG